jgi:hypothetical protein
MAAAGLGCFGLGSLQLGCVESVNVDESERAPVLAQNVPPVAEFDPASSVVPLPNQLLVDPQSGRLTLPPSCGETPGSVAAGLRIALEQLDGFGTSKVQLTATFSAAPDPESLAGHVFVVRLADHGVPLANFEGPVAVDATVGTTPRASADCTTSADVPTLRLVPKQPLLGSSTYGVLLTRGILTDSGEEFSPSPTWALVRQSEAPVQVSESADGTPSVDYNATPLDPANAADLQSIVGLDQLWRGHAPLLTAFDLLAPVLDGGTPVPRADMLLAWAFPTETIADPVDPVRSGSAANTLVQAPGAITVPAALAGAGAPLSVEQAYGVAIPGTPCTALGCDAIGSIYAASPLAAGPTFTSTSFLSGDDCTRPGAIGGAFADPVHPARVCDRDVSLLIVVPAAAPPAAGYPTIVFAHGLGRSKEDLLAIAGALARGGFASVAFDAVDHGSRAVQVSTDAALGCDGAGPDHPCTGTFGPTCAPQCFAPLLSPDLPRTRDHLRQTVLDQLKLVAALRGCSSAGACGALQVDPEHIGYLGQSLGSLIGGVSASLSPDLHVAALNVGAADWVQIFTDTDTLDIRCPLVDGLISAGVLTGKLWNQGANADALCLGDSWKTEPGFLGFAATARWLLDPVDAVNYAARYRTTGAPRVLLSEVVADAVVPNSATLTFGNLLGLDPQPASPATSLLPEPSSLVLQSGSHWLQYQDIAGNAAVQFPGNAYDHGSLLAPADPGPDMSDGSGALGTLQMQVDTVSFFAAQFGGAQ